MLKTETSNEKPARKEIPVTPGEAAAILQSAVSYCLDANLPISWMINDDAEAGTRQLWLVVDGLQAEQDNNGRLVISPADTTPAVSGSDPAVSGSDEEMEAENAKTS